MFQKSESHFAWIGCFKFADENLLYNDQSTNGRRYDVKFLSHLCSQCHLECYSCHEDMTAHVLGVVKVVGWAAADSGDNVAARKAAFFTHNDYRC